MLMKQFPQQFHINNQKKKICLLHLRWNIYPMADFTLPLDITKSLPWKQMLPNRKQEIWPIWHVLNGIHIIKGMISITGFCLMG